MISVLDDALFRVETLDGVRKRIGLRELLERSHEFADLCGRTPTGRLALLRLCVAFLEDIYHPREMEERADLLDEGRFDAERIEAYLAACEAGNAVFLLDDEKRPFMQMPYEAALDEKAEKSVAALFMDVPSGNAHVFIDHRHLDQISADAEDVLEGLLETYMFCTAGAQEYPSGANNTPPLYCVVRGGNLFETLVLNMVAEDELPNQIPFGEGLVPWRRTLRIRPKEKASTISFLEALTWQPRRVTMVFDEDRRVRRVFLQQGRNFVGDGRWCDPWVPFRKGKDGTDVSIKPEMGRQLWRDAGDILSARTNGSIEPVPIANAGEIWRSIPGGRLPVEAVGMITNQASILGIVHETLRIPEALLKDGVRSSVLSGWISLTEAIHGASFKIIAGECGKQTAQYVGEAFLTRMKEEIFGASLERLISAQTPEALSQARAAFGDALRDALLDSLRVILENSGCSVANLKRQNRIEGLAMGYCMKRLKGSC